MMKLNEKLAKCYQKLSKISTPEIIGKSEYDREILLFSTAKKPKVLLIGGIHAREWITTLLLTELVISEKNEIAVVPCINPDGMCLCLDGLNSVPIKDQAKLLQINGGNDFSLWKANARGVDLNVNFDADWGKGKKNTFIVGAENYVGEYPFCAKETQVARELLKRDYSLVLSYHSLGEEVYWGYGKNFAHYEEAKAYADYVGYILKKSINSSGGLKDYYALNYKGLAITVEVGKDYYGHPCPIEKLNELVSRHRGSLKLLCDQAEKIYGKIHENGAE